jgi:hypothetical protein
MINRGASSAPDTGPDFTLRHPTSAEGNASARLS